MNIKILPSAIADLRRGYHFYEAQDQGLGDYFQDSLFSDIDSLILYAGIHKVVYGCHRFFSKRFPFAIYYRMDGIETALVYRILDMRQNPQTTLKALNIQNP